ncbi:MAG: M23 family metallopeptidase [Deferribacteraceae bacterium]|jgi:murein DD-endopeptidase MepM/ murein hydrolase activator NlpD|nr:M23 family metallopeptidase [Deferribacteraceae bacterium]
MIKALLILFATIAPLTAMAELTISGGDNVSRGEPMVVRLKSTDSVKNFTIQWQNITVTPPAICNKVCTAEIILPTNYDKQGKFPLKVTAGKASKEKTINVKDRYYRVQKLKVEPKYVQPAKKDSERIQKESKITRVALTQFTPTKGWKLPMQKPINSKLSSTFGSARFFNGERRSKHSGLDFVGKTGDKISAVADGKVVLAQNLYFGGNAVYIDHGLGVVSASLHMSKMLVKKGDTVKRGQTIGLVGATGRVTGPHLHFSMFAQGVSIDPLLLF